MFSFRKNLPSVLRKGHLLHQSMSKHSLPAMPFEYNALEPILCGEIMEIHHRKHHATYINNLNNIEEQIKTAVQKNDFAKIVQLTPALKFNLGGDINHSIFWQNLSPKGGKPEKDLEDAITKAFGSWQCFKSDFQALCVGVQGSGWGWLGFNKKENRLQIAACANQDPLEPTTGLIPLLGIDVWEHAYYLQYKNVRPDYVKNIFEVINWEDINERYAKARC